MRVTAIQAVSKTIVNLIRGPRTALFHLQFCKNLSLSYDGTLQTCHSYWFYQNYTDFLHLKIGKIQIFFLKIWQNTDFFKGFLYSFFSHTGFFLKILIFLVIYADFVLDQSGRSDTAERNLSPLKIMKSLGFYAPWNLQSKCRTKTITPQWRFPCDG